MSRDIVLSLLPSLGVGPLEAISLFPLPAINVPDADDTYLILVSAVVAVTASHATAVPVQVLLNGSALLSVVCAGTGRPVVEAALLGRYVTLPSGVLSLSCHVPAVAMLEVIETNKPYSMWEVLGRRSQKLYLGAMPWAEKN